MRKDAGLSTFFLTRMETDPQLPEHLVRRDFLKKLAAAGTAAWMSGEPRMIWGKTGETVVQPPAKADACILLWMAGGMAAPETFDPKRYYPFEKGLEVKKMLSTFPAIDTRLRGCMGIEVTVKGPKIDLHSGLYGGPVQNPIKVVSRVIAAIHDKRGRITIPGFYDGVRPIPPKLRKQWAALAATTMLKFACRRKPRRSNTGLPWPLWLP